MKICSCTCVCPVSLNVSFSSVDSSRSTQRQPFAVEGMGVDSSALVVCMCVGVVVVVVVVVKMSSTVGLVILTLPFFTVRSKETTPRLPVASTRFALPEHFLSHLPLEDNTCWTELTVKKNEQVQVLEPNFNLMSSTLIPIGSMSFPSASLSSKWAPVFAVSESPRRKNGTHRQSAVDGACACPDSSCPGGQTALLPHGQDPSMEHTCRNPDGQGAGGELGSPVPLGWDAEGVGCMVVVRAVTCTTFRATLPFFTEKSKV